MARLRVYVMYCVDVTCIPVIIYPPAVKICRRYWRVRCNRASQNFKHCRIVLHEVVVTAAAAMGGATIGAGGHYPHLPKVEGTGGSKYIVCILHTCNKKYTLHVYSMR